MVILKLAMFQGENVFLRVFKQKSDLAGGPNLTRTSEESDPNSQKNDCVLTMHFITI